MRISKENKIFLRKLFIIALPIILQELINSSVNISDTFMISSLGEESIAAVGLANQIFFLFTLFIFGVNSGASVFMGQFWGAGDITSIHKTMGISFFTSFFIACLFAIPAFFFPDVLIGYYSDDPLVIDIASQYLRIACFTYLLISFSYTINFALKSTGKTIYPMITTLVAFITNITLNYYFIFIAKEGVTGAAKGTLIARTIEIILQYAIAKLTRQPILGPIKNYLSFNFEFVKTFFKKAGPVIANEAVWAAGVTQYTMLYGKVGTDAQATVQIANSIKQLFMVISIGIGSSSGIILGNLLGSNRIDKAKKYAGKYIKVIFVLSIVMALILITLSPVIVQIFNVSDSVKSDTQKILFIIALLMPILTFNYLTIVGILRSGGDTTFCLIIDLIAVWLIGVPFTFIGVKLGLPIYLVVLCSYTDEIGKFIFVVFRVRQEKWAKNLTR